jgi:alpha-L-arabinofuranosidase
MNKIATENSSRRLRSSLLGIIVWLIAELNVHAQTVNSNCIVDIFNPGAAVADICRGQQIEEFNHQFEGGLYAQLINNPSFEELKNPIASWSLVKSGSSSGELYSQTSAETNMLNIHQEHCIKLEVTSVASGRVGLANGGYWGIGLKNNTNYRVSFWVRRGLNFSGTINVRLESNDGMVYAQSIDFKPATEWQHFTCDLLTSGVAGVSGTNRFAIYASTTGDVYFDVVTVMPPTWKNRPNGLRPDLAEKLAALKLKYIQFPGGCTAESASMDTCWNWKNSIGPLEQRPGSTRNRWGYKNDLYFGLDEYLQLCADLGAEPVYVTSSGISETPDWGPYGVCPLDKMQPIIKDILDLLEYCNGPASTTWGAQRAANGHPVPYNLTYIEIGNENGWQTVKDYIPRYSMIHDSVLAHYPEIKIMFNGTGVPSSTTGNFLDFADEHFYLKDCATLYNKYDSINPDCKKICVAEYASSINGNGGNVIGNFGDALADAVFMLGCEKNSERIWWTGYGNYSGFFGHGDFGPCIVWNDAVSNFATPSYYMQKMLFSDNQGTRVLPLTQNTVHCYWSASIDTKSGKNDILLKVVNKSADPEFVNITLSGKNDVNPVGQVTVLTAAPVAENTLANPVNVIPLTGPFAAGRSFGYLVPAYSGNVLRIGLLQGRVNQ